MPTRNRDRVYDLLAILLLVVISIGFVVANVQKHTSVSPIDEYVYIDYVSKIPTQGVVRQGEEVGTLARDYLACAGVRFIGTYPDSLCATHGLGPDSEYPNAGETTADIYTMLYPATAWVSAQLFSLVGVDSLVTGARLGGMFWLAAAAAVLFIALRRLGAARPLAFGVAMFVAVSPLAEWSNTYVSTDASALLAGSSMLLLLTLRWRRTGAKVGAFAVLGMLLTLLKVQNIAAVGFAALFLLVVGVVRSFRRSRRDGGFLGRVIRDRDVLTAVATVVASVAAQAIWLVIRSQLSLDGSPDQGVGTRLSGTALLAESFRFLPSMLGLPVPFEVDAPITFISRVGSLLAAVGVLGLLFAARAGSKRAMFAGSLLTVTVVLGPLLALLSVVTAGYYFTLPSRYGMSLAPICFAALCLLISRKHWPGYAFIAAGIASFAVTCAAGIGS